jgi:predicted MarR family transcription regulator
MEKQETEEKSTSAGQESVHDSIAASSQLPASRGEKLSEFEFGLVIAGNAFTRWAVRCMSAAGIKDMTITDVLVLHHINHRARGKKLSDIAFILNIEDTHVVNYALKKLQSLGMVNAEKHGKEVLYSTNEKGRNLCLRYADIREQVLLSTMIGDDTQNTRLVDLAHLLRVLSGLYDQAARAAASF